MAKQYVPHKKQAEAHKAFLVDDFERGCIFWSRRVGKSVWMLQHMILSMLMRQGPHWIVFDTRQHAKDVVWNRYLHQIPKQYISEVNATDLTITFHHIKGAFNLPGIGWQWIEHDPEELPSTLTLTGSDTADRDRGGEAVGIMFDEYQDQDPGNWDEVYEPFLATTEGWACFMGTAKGYNHWYEMLQFAQQEENDDWFYSEATWRDNPLISAEWIAKSKETARRRGTLDSWMQEYELQFRTIQGAVYPMFDRKIHLISPNDERITTQDLTWYGTIDWGHAEGHPMASNFVGIDSQDRWFVTDEIHGTEIDIDDFLNMLRIQAGDRRVLGYIADSARPDLIAYARKKGFNIIEAKKPQGSLQSGITLLKQRMRPKLTVLGDPQPNIFFTRNCKHTIFQFEKYKYREISEDRAASSEPIKKHDDHPDGIRYLQLWLKLKDNKKETKLSRPKRTNQYGIVMP